MILTCMFPYSTHSLPLNFIILASVAGTENFVIDRSSMIDAWCDDLVLEMNTELARRCDVIFFFLWELLIFVSFFRGEIEPSVRPVQCYTLTLSLCIRPTGWEGVSAERAVYKLRAVPGDVRIKYCTALSNLQLKYIMSSIHVDDRVSLNMMWQKDCFALSLEQPCCLLL